MSESLEAIFQHVIWNFCYLSVLLGLSAFGIHRYFIIYLFLRHRRKRVEPAENFRDLPFVTVQLPVFNEITSFAGSLGRSAASTTRETGFKSRFWTTLRMKPARLPRAKPPA